jgi:hypothetical protein
MLKTQTVRAYYLFDSFLLFKVTRVSPPVYRNNNCLIEGSNDLATTNETGEILVGDVQTGYEFKLINIHSDKMFRDIRYKRPVN